MEIGTGMAEKSNPGTRQRDSKNWVWFGDIERKLAELSMTTLITVLPLNYFMVCTLIEFTTYEPTVPTYLKFKIILYCR